MKLRTALFSPPPIIVFAISLLVVPGCSYGQDVVLCSDVERPSSEHPQVFAGQDGWLFSGADLRDRIPFEPTLPFFERLVQGLAGEGTELVVLIVPTRGMVYQDRFPDHLPANLTSASMDQARDHYRQLIGSLEELGIIAPDLLAAATAQRQQGEPFFFKLDHHWTPGGAQAAAQAIAAAIREASPGYERLDKVEHETNLVRTVENGGSYLRTVKQVCGIELEDEPLERYVTTIAAGDQAALFADIATEVVLVGTSYSSRSQPRRDFNFSGFLSQFLSLGGINYAVAAAGPFAAIEAFFLDDGAPQPSYLVWEIPARNFPTADGFRQLTPALQGPCGRDDALFATTAELGDGSVPTVEVPELELPVEGGFLVLDFESLDILRFDATIHYLSESRTHPVRRSSRVANPGRFYLDLPDFGGETVRGFDLDIHSPGAARGRLDLLVCAIERP